MIDVFICIYVPDEVRYGMAISTIARWRQEPGCKLNLLIPTDFEIYAGWNDLSVRRVCQLKDFQRLRRACADGMAVTDPYICADDDILLTHLGMIKQGCFILRKHPEFSILSSLPLNARISRWTPSDGYDPYVDDEVEEHIDVGQVRFCRKGHMEQWPPQATPGYDRTHCEAVRARGKRVGYFTQLFHNHLGEGYSTIWR